jgi:hypothetical protein
MRRTVVERWPRLGARTGVATMSVWCTSAAPMTLLGLSGASPYQLWVFFAFLAFFCGYPLFSGKLAANGTSAFNHLAKLSFTDSGAISAIRLV